MPQFGASLKARFSVTQQQGVQANDLPMDVGATEPDLAVITPEVDAIFGGQLLNLSVQKFTLTQAEKDLLLINCILRYSRWGVSGSYWHSSAPLSRVNFYLAGLGQWVDKGDVMSFLGIHAKTMGGLTPDQFFVGGFKRLE